MARDPLAGATETTLLNELRELKRRVLELEKSNPLTGAMPWGAQIKVKDGNGDDTAVIGGPNGGTAFYNSAGSEIVTMNDQGLTVVDSSGDMLTQIGDGGHVLPVLAYPCVPSIGTTVPFNVTSASFTSVMWSSVLRMPSDSVTCWVPVETDVGTTGEVRLYTAFGTTSAVSFSGALQFKVFDWLHGVSLSSNADFIIQIRRSAGAGNVRAYLPSTGMSFCGQDVFNATASGV